MAVTRKKKTGKRKLTLQEEKAGKDYASPGIRGSIHRRIVNEIATGKLKGSKYHSELSRRRKRDLGETIMPKASKRKK